MSKVSSFLLLTFLLFSSAVIGQKSTLDIPKGLFLDANAGIRTGGGKVFGNNENNLNLHIDGGVGYMFNKYYGIKGDLGFDLFNIKETTAALPDKSLTLRANVQGVLSISDLAQFGTPSFRLLLHAGPGISSNFNPSFRQGGSNRKNDKGFLGNDDMINVVAGLTGQYHLTRLLSLNFDVTTVYQTRQDHYLERMYRSAKINTYNSNMLNISVGVQYRIDDASVNKIIKKKSSTSTKTPTVQPENQPVQPQPEIKPEQVKPEQVKPEPVKPEPAVVDTDNDGVADADDKCPNQAGGDKGCPVVDYKVNNVLFKTGSSVLSEVAKKDLNAAAKYLSANPDVKVKVEGHADATGTEQINTKLSANRSNAVKLYLSKKGISADRISVDGFSSTQPVSDNNTSKGRAQNRRAEIKLSKY